MADETSEASEQAHLDFLAKQMAAASQKARRFATVAWPASGSGPMVVGSPGLAAPDGPASITSPAVAGNSPAEPMASMRWFWIKTEA